MPRLSNEGNVNTKKMSWMVAWTWGVLWSEWWSSMLNAMVDWDVGIVEHDVHHETRFSI